jgi:23S rRNA pseudouridine2457 synthase
MKEYYILYKPFGMLSQFSKELEQHRSLADLSVDFKKDVYPVGRLDKDSEGLLILSNDKSLTDRLLNPKNKHQRSYWVQVEGQPNSAALEALRKGVDINIKKKTHRCNPVQVEVLHAPPIEARQPPIRYRKNSPTTWLNLVLTEGKNRQVRRMTAKIGYPTLRLIRHSIESLHIADLEPAAVKKIDGPRLYQLLQLDKIG